MLSFDFIPETKNLRCFFKGRMDTVICAQIGPVLESKLASLPDEAEKDLSSDLILVFDLKEVEFISSSFIRICVAFSKRVTSGHFCIENCNPFIKKTFKIAGLDAVLNVK